MMTSASPAPCWRGRRGIRIWVIGSAARPRADRPGRSKLTVGEPSYKRRMPAYLRLRSRCLALVKLFRVFGAIGDESRGFGPESGSSVSHGRRGKVGRAGSPPTQATEVSHGP